jgi:GH35 family endo-1,4-beta-xylanase
MGFRYVPMNATSSKFALSALAWLSPVAALCLWAGPAQAQSLVTNGTFDADTAPWWGNAASTAENPADYTLAATDGQLCATMMAGGKNPWDVIVGYSGLALLPNQYYHIAFTISADVNRTVKFKTGLGVAPYTDYFLKTIQVTTAPTTVNFTYLNLRNDATAQAQFQIGATAGKVCFDDVVIEPVAAPTVPPYVTPSANGHPLKDYKALVKMGTAVDTPIFLSNPQHNAIVAGEFSMITPANSMKMGLIQPTQGTFDFTDTDALVAWAKQNNLEFRGHPLVWHTQAPAWLTDGTFTRDEMIAIMYAHIDGLMSHYAGQFPYWDVVNEAIDQKDGMWTFRPTFWHERIGDDFIDLAFTHARAADPSAKLVYNDYNIEQKGNPKADRVFELVKDMKTRGIPIDAVGLQAHYFVEPNGNTSSGVPDMQAIRDNMARYAEIGIEVHITECDFRIGKPLDDTKAQLQNKFFSDLLQVCIDAPNCSLFTVWGLSDLDSWVPSTFKDYDFAHLFDAALAPKPAYHGLTQVFAKYNTDGTLIGATPPPAPPPAAGTSSSGGDSGGCSLASRPDRMNAGLLAGLALLGLALSRRVSKRKLS